MNGLNWLRTRRVRAAGPWILVAALVVVTVLSVGSAFRDNDQAMFVFGGRMLAAGKINPFSNSLYNYDRQWGTYWLLAALDWAAPHVDAVLGGNLLQAVLLLVAMVAAILIISQRGRAPMWLYLPVFLSPALVLYTPFLSTASLSLGFLLLALAMLRSGSRLARKGAWIAVLCAAACRGDVVLVIPALLLANMARKRLLPLLRDRRIWIFALAAMCPVIAGRLMETRLEPAFAGWFFFPLILGGFVVFALGLGAFALLGTVVISRARAMIRHRDWWVFYALEMTALLIPVLFYWPQLYSGRYFYLTLVTLLIVATSRRSVISLRRTPVAWGYAVIALTLLPWLAGVRMPHRNEARVVLAGATTFPTSDGSFPMGAFGSFAVQLATRDHFEADHNQKTWEAARSVEYEACDGARVPIMGSPMRDYLMLAVELQGKTPWFVSSVRDSPCGKAYVDSRSLVRGEGSTEELKECNLTVVSHRPDLGYSILLAEFGQPKSAQTQTLQALRSRMHGRDGEVYFTADHPAERISLSPAFTYFFLSDGAACPAAVPEMAGLRRVRDFREICFEWSGESAATIVPGDLPGITGWAHTVFPDYLRR